jgi:RNA-directed DNA polymerase
MTLEPKDKLDATTVVANGPEGEPLAWDAVDWRACEQNVRRLRQRIFTASQAGDLKRCQGSSEFLRVAHENSPLGCVCNRLCFRVF